MKPMSKHAMMTSFLIDRAARSLLRDSGQRIADNSNQDALSNPEDFSMIPVTCSLLSVNPQRSHNL